MQIFSFEYLKGNINKHAKGPQVAMLSRKTFLHALEDIRS